MEKIEISETVLEEVLEDHRKRAIASQVADLAWGIANGEREFLELPAALQSLSEEHYQIVQPEIEFVTDDLEELYNNTYGRSGLKWRLKTLRKMMGSLRKGDFGFLFARPEAGKTTFIADQCGHMAVGEGIGDRPLLHFNNEEFGHKVKLRYYQAILGVTNRELFSNRDECNRRFLDQTRGRIKLIDRAQLFKTEVEEICKRTTPALIVLDSIDKIQGFEDDRDDLKYKKIYQWARELSKEYGPVVGVCHAAASGEGKKYLEMDDVAYAKCLDPNTKVLMYDGRWLPIKDIHPGDQVMGPDSYPRNVLSKARGREEMFKIIHRIGGDSYIVNKSHVLTLRHQSGEIRDVPLEYYLKYPTGYKGIRSGYSLPEKILPLDPYWFGLWLGDGHHKRPEVTTQEPEIKSYIKQYAQTLGYSYVELKNGNNGLVQSKVKGFQGKPHLILEALKFHNVYGNKHVPEIYLRSHEKQRLFLLAGLIDSDGCLIKRKHYYYEFCNKNAKLAKAVKDLSLSCGLMATMKKCGGYYKVRISGHIQKIPCLVSRKICPATYKPYKRVTDSSLIVEPLGVGEYCGFTLDGDHRFILENCIVSHNTAKQGEADWILGIGKTHEPSDERRRFLSLSKNKLIGDEEMDEQYRHGKLPVRLYADVAQYEDEWEFD